MNQSVFVILVITLNVALGMSFRHRRQSDSESDDSMLADRYGRETSWSRPGPNQGVRWPRRNQGHRWPRLPQPSSPQAPPPTQPNQRPTPQPTTEGTTTTTTTQSPAVRQCIRNCPVTSEYNPVCGTDLVKYNNPGRLECAKFCGVNVNLLRPGPCPGP